jgi:purine-binding chemotaxis protein CheW
MKKEEQNLSNLSNSSYLTFKLGNEVFGVHVSQVLNILEMTRITKVPKSPKYMRGVINLRGMVLPVIDTRIRVGLPEAEDQKNTCIIVMELSVDGIDFNVGTIVDEVLSVIEIYENQTEPPPSLGNNYKSDFIVGMAKTDENFTMIIDMNRLFSAVEISELQSNKEQNKSTEEKKKETTAVK